jgi:ubiquitin-conjugating enzyme E2 variant
MSSTKTYDYSPAHRALEIVSILTLAVCVGLLFYEVWLGSKAFPATSLWLVPSSVLAAYLVADFVSGFVHFLGDTFGDEKTPVLGESFIQPFRIHHVDPRRITRHDFIETNGNNCIVCIPTVLFVYFALPARTELWALWLVSFTAWFMIGIFMTNQFHKWAHLEEPPAWIAVLQDCRLILSPDHHDVHHTPPFDKYYCITTGWLNPVLNSVGFFPRTEALLRWIFRAPKPAAEAPANSPS